MQGWPTRHNGQCNMQQHCNLAKKQSKKIAEAPHLNVPVGFRSPASETESTMAQHVVPGSCLHARTMVAQAAPAMHCAAQLSVALPPVPASGNQQKTHQPCTVRLHHTQNTLLPFLFLLLPFHLY
jgi:hypothetical protein